MNLKAVFLGALNKLQEIGLIYKQIISALFFIVIWLAFAKFRIITSNGEIKNQLACSLYNTVFWITLFLFSLLELLESRNKIQQYKIIHAIKVFSLFCLMVLLTYGPRFTHLYTFQDDWFHLISVSRLSFLEGLFIPFVDHITPVWRLIHLLFITILGGYNFLIIFPYLGAFNIAILGVVLYFLLRKSQVRFPLLCSILLVIFPGYASVMYWISTNAVSLSSIFGLLLIYYHWEMNLKKIIEGDEISLTQVMQQKSYLIKLNLVMCVLSWLSYSSWTTGLSFSMMCLASTIFVCFMRSLKIKGQARFGFYLNLIPYFIKTHWGIILSILIFIVSRQLVYSMFDEEFLSRNLWTGNALYHGFEFNILRPFLWPIMSIVDGTIFSGLFNITFDNSNFYLVILRGLVFITISIYLFKNTISKKYLILAYLFAFISFAIIFAGRGIGSVTNRTPNGYLDYALGNDWYRIAVVVGFIFYCSLASRPLFKSHGGKLKYILLFLIFCSYVTASKTSMINHRMLNINHFTAEHFESMKCLNNLSLDSEDLNFARHHLYFPLIGSNPGNFWLYYEPSWFDLLPVDTATLWSEKSLKFTPEKQKAIEMEISNLCGPKIIDDFRSFAFKPDLFPNLETNLVHLKVESLGGGKYTISIPHPDSFKEKTCLWSQFQLLEFSIIAESPAENEIPAQLLVNETSYQIPRLNQWISANNRISFELRSLPAKDKCEENLVINLRSSKLKIENPKGLLTPMNADYYIRK